MTCDSKLEKSQDQLKTILSNVKDPIFVISYDLEIMYANQIAQDLFGETLIGKKCYQIIKNGEEPCILCPKISLEKKDICKTRFEQCIASSPTNELKFFDIVSSKIGNYEGKPAFVQVLRDVTEKKRLFTELEKSEKTLKILKEQMEQKVEQKTKELVKTMNDLKKSEEKYRTIIKNLDYGFYNATINGVLLDHNIKFNEILGFDLSKNLIGLQLPDYWQNPADREIYKQELIKNRSIKNYLIKARRQNGEGIIVNASSHIIFNNEGIPERIEGTLFNVTKEYFLEQDFKQIFELSPDMICTAGYDTYFRSINPAFRKTLGYTEEELLSRPFLDFVHPDDKETTLAEIGRSSRGNFTNRYKCKDGSYKWLEWTANPVKEDKIIYAVAHDITERKRMEDELKEMIEELKRSNEELEQFAYVASHDLQEPLRMVASFTQLLQRRYQDKLDKDANDFINFAVDGANRMQALINDLLLYSRVGTRGKPFNETDMNQVLKSVLISLKPRIEEEKAIINYDPLPVIIADESQMVQLLQNLLSNAIKFHGEAPPKIQVSGVTKEKEWIFSVKDNGIGIDPRYFERLFIIFQRLHGKNEYEGTGIGLAVCKKIVLRHGGKIWVGSKPGEGSTFYFSIPRNKINLKIDSIIK